MESVNNDVSEFDIFTAKMRHEFLKSSSEFAATEELSLVIGSWNVNAKEEESHNMSQWLSDSAVKRAEVVVVGLQEVIELSPTNTVIGSSYSGSSQNSSSISYNSCERWLNKLLAHLNKDATVTDHMQRFSLLESLSMVGTAIFVFVRAQWRARIRHVQARSISRGGGGLLGNKGAVCIRFEVNDTSLCFCSAHLCAHREDVERRNDDFRAIFSTPVFQPPGFSALQRLKSDSRHCTRNVATAAAAGRVKAKLRAREGARPAEDAYLQKVKDHDVVFFFGDLNYRVAEGFEIAEVYDVLALSAGCRMEPVNAVLLEQDQLNIERREQRAFQGFQEAPIGFKPTYQYLAGTDEYDRRPDRKLRCPGWCDRVLWKTNSATLLFSKEEQEAGEAQQAGQSPRPVGQVRCLSYERGENIISDHKPVSAELRVSTLQIDAGAKERALVAAAEAWRRRRGSGEDAPAVVVSPHFLTAESCPAAGASANVGVDAAPVTLQLRLSNAGSGPVEYCVTAPCWLAHIAQQQQPALVPPAGETFCEFTVDVEAAMAFISSSQQAGMVQQRAVVGAVASAAMSSSCSAVSEEEEQGQERQEEGQRVELSSFVQLSFRATGSGNGGGSSGSSRAVEVPVRCSFVFQQPQQ